jgi:hypothetical protein
MAERTGDGFGLEHAVKDYVSVDTDNYATHAMRTTPWRRSGRADAA